MALTTATATFGAASCFVSTIIGNYITYDTIPAAFPSCNAMASVYTGCNSLTGKSLDSCVCNQDLFNDIYGCWNEWRICQRSNEGDHNAQSVLSNWHAQCDRIATPTTPPLTTLPASVSQCPVQVRQQFQAACTQAVAAGNACYAQYPSLSQSASYSSCVCQSSILSWASVCEYDGNKTCLARTPTLSNIPVWSFCPTVAASLIAEQSAAATGSDYTYLPSSAMPSATTVPVSTMPSVTMSSTMSAGAASSTTSSVSSADVTTEIGSQAMILMMIAILAFGMVVTT